MESSSLTGAWELVSDTHEGLLFIAGDNWGEITVEKDRRQFAWDKMTERDELSAFRTLEAVGGRFDLSGMTATADVTVAKFPGDGRDDRHSRLRRHDAPGTRENVYRRMTRAAAAGRGSAMMPAVQRHRVQSKASAANPGWDGRSILSKTGRDRASQYWSPPSHPSHA